jgi:hypothetical protein
MQIIGERAILLEATVKICVNGVGLLSPASSSALREIDSIV